MNDFDRKRDRALALLARTGIMKRNYLPPTYPILWRLGLEVPPPHFLSFWNLLLITGLPFGICWIGLCLGSFEAHGLDMTLAVLGFVIVVGAPGAVFASYYTAGRKRFRLPKWSEL